MTQWIVATILFLAGGLFFANLGMRKSAFILAVPAALCAVVALHGLTVGPS